MGTQSKKMVRRNSIRNLFFRIVFMKRYITIFCVVIITNITFAQELKEEYITHIQTFIDAIKNDDTQILKTLIKYPLNREYPIPDIKDENDFVKRYDQIFDDVLKNIIINSKLDKDWEAVGWRGIMLYSGVVWIDYEGKLIGLNYQSNKEEALLNKLLEEDKSSLHHSLVNFKRPEVILETKKFRIRIDQLNNDLYRYASWSIDSETNVPPDLVLQNGEVIFDGSGGNHSYKFTNGGYVYKCFINVLKAAEAPPASLAVYKDKEELLFEGAQIIKQ